MDYEEINCHQAVKAPNNGQLPNIVNNNPAALDGATALAFSQGKAGGAHSPEKQLLAGG